MTTQPGSRVSSMKHQAGHGFARGQPIVFSGGVYRLATTATGFNGVCGTIPDINRFELVVGGELDGLSGLTPETTLYLTGTAGTLSTTGTLPVLRVNTASTAWILAAQEGGTTVSNTSTAAIDAAIAAHVAAPNPHPQYVQSINLPTEIAAASGVIGGQIFESDTAQQVRVLIEDEPVTRTLVYTGELLTSTSDAYGTQAFSYDGNGRLDAITGTGKYRSKTFTYTGDQLTGIGVLP